MKKFWTHSLKIQNTTRQITIITSVYFISRGPGELGKERKKGDMFNFY